MDEPTPTQVTQSTTPSPTSVVKEKHSRAFSFVSVLFLLTLLGAGVMAYLWYNQKADVDQLNNEVASAKSGQVTLQAQIDKLKKQNANLGNAVVDTVANGTTVKSDDDVIKATVTARPGRCSSRRMAVGASRKSSCILRSSWRKRACWRTRAPCTNRRTSTASSRIR